MPGALWQNRCSRRVHALLVTLATAAVLPICGITPLHAQSTVGVYRDVNGSGCTLNDLTVGNITAYVVLRPDANGATGLQFAAPKPACFTGVYLGDEAAPGTLVIGDSQTGVSVALLGCKASPTHVLTIRYAGLGTTPTCCEYPVVPDPLLTTIDVVDCGFFTHEGVGIVSRFNADATCPCVGNTPPSPPQYLQPVDGAQNVSVFQTLSWYAEDVDDNIAGYDVYLGTDPVPPLVASDVPAPAYDPGQLTPLAQHYWRIVVRDLQGAETSGPVWTFSTRDTNSPPVIVGAPIPANGATGVYLSASLVWGAADIDGDPLVFDIYFGTSPDPPLLAANHPNTSYAPAGLQFDTLYYWRIVARDPPGHETSSPVWSFTTRLPSYPPYPPSSPFPANGTTGVSLTATLAWLCADPDGDALRFDVYFGTTSPPPLVAANQLSLSYNPGPLDLLTQYYWRVVARDGDGLETSGPQWTFTTRGNLPPAVPSNPSPSDYSVNRPTNTTLAWLCSDPDGHTITYDVYFGVTPVPPLVASDVPTTAYEPGPLAFLTTYYWRIVARDALGAQTSGPVWRFTTWADNLPPNPPSNPIPANNGFASATPILQWSASDPNGQALTYDVYFGTDPTPPLAVTGIGSKSYVPGTLQLNTYYYWRVVAFDGQYSTSGPTWSFYTIPPNSGPSTVGIYSDMSGSGCALSDVSAGLIYAYVILRPGPGGATGLQFAAPKPPCFTGAYVGDAVQQPFLSIGNSQTGLSVALTSCLDVPTHIVTIMYFGYGTTLPCCEYPVVRDPLVPEIIVVDCSFVEQWSQGIPASFNPTTNCPCGTSVPVLISSFEAKAAGDGVDVRWALAGDENAERFTLLRRVETVTAPSVVGQGVVTGTTGSFHDDSVEPATTYHYELIVRTSGGDEFRSPVATVTTPAIELALGQNHPNPFNPQTTIPYTLPAGATHVRLAIMDVAGKRVRTLVDETQSGGTKEVIWDGRDDRGGAVSSGVYFYVLDAGNRRLTRKLVLLK